MSIHELAKLMANMDNTNRNLQDLGNELAESGLSLGDNISAMQKNIVDGLAISLALRDTLVLTKEQMEAYNSAYKKHRSALLLKLVSE